MTGKESVEQTLKGHTSSQKSVPKGEIEIATDFVHRMLTHPLHAYSSPKMNSFSATKGDKGQLTVKYDKNRKGKTWYSETLKSKDHSLSEGRMEKRRVMEILGVDLVTVDLSGVLEKINERVKLTEIEEWAKDEDFFVFAMIGGVFWPLCHRIGLENYCFRLKNDHIRLQAETEELQKKQVYLAIEALKRGADGLIIADDLAYQKGTFLSPEDLRKMIFPYLRDELETLKEKEKPVFLHSCGNINSVIDELVSMGFDGLQGLQPSSGMNIKQIKEKFGRKITLMGNFEPDCWDIMRLENIKEEVHETLRCCRQGGRYIAGTSGGLSLASDVSLIVKLYSWFFDVKGH